MQLDEDFAVLASISDRTRLYNRLNSDGLEEYLASNLCNVINNMMKLNLILQTLQKKKKKKEKKNVTSEESYIISTIALYRYIVTNIRFDR